MGAECTQRNSQHTQYGGGASKSFMHVKRFE
jgi:hypothetical protein